MKILITGICGFIGSNIADKLVSLGHDVCGIDNLSTGKIENISNGIILFKKDIRSILDVHNSFEEFKPEIVIHLAANASIIKAQNDPTFDMKNNLIGTMNIVEACNFWKVKHLIYASSMTVYGNQVPPFKENKKVEPSSFYALSKYSSEQYIKLNYLKNSLNYTSLRMFNVYGPKQDLDNPFQNVVAIFMNKCLKNKDITIFGDGKQTRDFVYIDDVVNSYVKCLNNNKVMNKIINIGSGKETSIKYMALKIKSLFNKKVNLIYDDSHFDAQKRSKSDIKLAKKLLNWTPKVNFIDGINRTKKWHDKNITK